MRRFSKFHHIDKQEFNLTADSTDNKKQEIASILWSSDDQNMKELTSSESAQSSPKNKCSVYDTFTSIEKLEEPRYVLSIFIDFDYEVDLNMRFAF